MNHATYVPGHAGRSKNFLEFKARFPRVGNPAFLSESERQLFLDRGYVAVARKKGGWAVMLRGLIYGWDFVKYPGTSHERIERTNATAVPISDHKSRAAAQRAMNAYKREHGVHHLYISESYRDSPAPLSLPVAP